MSGVADPYNLQRFLEAQDSGDCYRDACAELRNGRKTTHWMWFVFPQLRALGRSTTAQFFGIGSLPEARDYLAHPVLGSRLRECARILRDLPGERSIDLIMGSVDAMKLRSSMTLFSAASDDPAEFQAVLDRYYRGQPDDQTVALLKPV